MVKQWLNDWLPKLQGTAHTVLLDRNKDDAERIISGFPRHNESVYEFERIDAASMKDVRRVTRSLFQRIGKANFIVASAGDLDDRRKRRNRRGARQEAGV